MKTKLQQLIAAALVCGLAMTANADPKIEKKQKDIRSMAHETLNRLYKADPKAKSAIEGAAGHAVFSNKGIKILVAGSAGEGVSQSTTRPSVRLS
jgi:glutamate synthase domain-containing protein 3